MRDAIDVVRAFWDDVWSQGNAALLSEIVHPDATENGEPFDVPGFRSGVTAWRKVFPDFTAAIDDIFLTDDGRVVTRVTYRGTQHLPWAGLPATGRTASVLGIDVFRVVDGQITELWHSTDHLVFAMELGARLVLKPEVEAELETAER